MNKPSAYNVFKQEYGTVKYRDQELALEQKPDFEMITHFGIYRARCSAQDGMLYEAVWHVKECYYDSQGILNLPEDENDACDWSDYSVHLAMKTLTVKIIEELGFSEGSSAGLFNPTRKDFAFYWGKFKEGDQSPEERFELYGADSLDENAVAYKLI